MQTHSQCFLQNVFSEAINQGKRSDINSVIRDMKAFVMAQKPGARTSVNGYLAAKSEDRAYIDMELYKAVPADFDKLIGVLGKRLCRYKPSEYKQTADGRRFFRRNGRKRFEQRTDV